MAATIPTSEPESFNAGDTVKWTKSTPDYLPADGWVLTYALVQGADQQTITATDNGDGAHLVTIALADSANYQTGIYFWQAYVTLSGERFKVGEGRLEVKPDFATQATGYDARSHVKKVLDALEATILGKATKDQTAYTIGDKSISRMTPEEIIKWQNHYKQLYATELQNERINNGDVSGNKILTRF